MSTAIATLPRAGGNGAALVVVAADLLIGLLAALKAKATSKVTVVTEAAVKPMPVKPAKELSIWQMYRLTAGYDSIRPEVAAQLRKEFVG